MRRRHNSGAGVPARHWAWSAMRMRWWAGFLAVMIAVGCRAARKPSINPIAAAPASRSIAQPTPPPAAKQQPKLLDFTLANLKGKPVKLSGWRGHPMVVDFWATWCPPCRKEVPELNAIYRKYRSRGLVVVGISVDEVQGDGVKSVLPFAREFKIRYPILMADKAMVDALDLDDIPTTFFLDRAGRVVDRIEGAGTQGLLAQAAKHVIGN